MVLKLPVCVRSFPGDLFYGDLFVPSCPSPKISFVVVVGCISLSCGMQDLSLWCWGFSLVLALRSHGIWDLHSLTKNQTCVPCVGRQIVNQWTTRKVPRLRLRIRMERGPDPHLNPPTSSPSEFNTRGLLRRSSDEFLMKEDGVVEKCGYQGSQKMQSFSSSRNLYLLISALLGYN